MTKKSLGVVAVLFIITAFVAGFYLLSAGKDPEEDMAALTDIGTTQSVEADTPVPAPPVQSQEASPVSSSRVMVEVQGAVAAPGVYSFPTDARVFDALQKAGGPLDSAEIRDINIAAILQDGSVLSVPFRPQGKGAVPPGAADLNPPAYTRSGWSGEAAQQGAAGGASAAQSSASDKININTATQAELETLPGVGVKTAEKIISFRQTQPFTQVDDLRYVQGIGEKRMETLRPHVTVD